jgi:hypothetical protein
VLDDFATRSINRSFHDGFVGNVGIAGRVAREILIAALIAKVERETP